jgi:hypothetical protein
MVAWTSESIVLDNFAVYLAMNKSMIGYAAFVRGLNEPKSHFEQRIARVKSHLINKRGLAADQLIIIRVKKRKTTPWTVLQPIERDLRPPDFEKALGG